MEQGLGEVVNCVGHFQTFVENNLPLQPDVAGPFDEVVEVPFGLDALMPEFLGLFSRGWPPSCLP